MAENINGWASVQCIETILYECENILSKFFSQKQKQMFLSKVCPPHLIVSIINLSNRTPSKDILKREDLSEWGATMYKYESFPGSGKWIKAMVMVSESHFQYKLYVMFYEAVVHKNTR